MLFHSKCLKMIEHTVTNAKSQHVVYHNDVIFKLYYDVIYQADVGLNSIETVWTGVFNVKLTKTVAISMKETENWLNLV